MIKLKDIITENKSLSSDVSNTISYLKNNKDSYNSCACMHLFIVCLLNYEVSKVCLWPTHDTHVMRKCCILKIKCHF